MFKVGDRIKIVNDNNCAGWNTFYVQIGWYGKIVELWYYDYNANHLISIKCDKGNDSWWIQQHCIVKVDSQQLFDFMYEDTDSKTR
jgi:hypothetical protein